MSKGKKLGWLRVGNYYMTAFFQALIIALVVAVAAFVVVNKLPAGEDVVDQAELLARGDFEEEGLDAFGDDTYTEGEDAFATAEPTPIVTPEPTPTAEPTPTPEPTPKSVRIRALGEIAIEQAVLDSAKVDTNVYDFTDIFSDIADVVADADYTIADVEGSMGDTSEYTGSDNKFITPSSLITALRACGVDMLTMANDHVLDGGVADEQATLQNCLNEGMAYIGAAASEAEKNTPKIVTINDVKVGFLSYTMGLNGNQETLSSEVEKYCVNYIDASNYKTMQTDVETLQSAGADVIIACVSWGKMGSQSITTAQKNMIKALTKLNVDVIIGYNPHLVQPAKWFENGDHKTLCVTATGNFLSNQRSQYMDSGMIFEFTIQEKEDGSGYEIAEPKYIPTYVRRDKKADGSGYEYRTLAVGDWLETAPEGMSDEAVTRMRTVWTELQSIVGSDLTEIAR